MKGLLPRINPRTEIMMFSKSVNQVKSTIELDLMCASQLFSMVYNILLREFLLMRVQF